MWVWSERAGTCTLTLLIDQESEPWELGLEREERERVLSLQANKRTSQPTVCNAYGIAQLLYPISVSQSYVGNITFLCQSQLQYHHACFCKWSSYVNDLCNITMVLELVCDICISIIHN